MKEGRPALRPYADSKGEPVSGGLPFETSPRHPGYTLDQSLTGAELSSIGAGGVLGGALHDDQMRVKESLLVQGPLSHDLGVVVEE